ncbi:glycosyltransferase family 4 protein [Parabacteroides pacaensis]|uniref:glycosyltransferase family 4 protein n=1 Tax=Parabacteroides pacaensis TaxID=2086575 RepID=UPI000D10407F|nr:glycosyltransferase family 4 protein [Parabacteroides pacaensis]
MKIVFIGGRDIHKLGGIENYMYNLATHLVKNGHTPVVYCESDKNQIEYVNGFKVIHQRSWGGRYICKILLSYKASVKSLLYEKDTMVYHYNTWVPSLSSWLPRIFGKIVILQGHGLEWKRTKYSPFQQKIMHFMEYITAKAHKNLLMVSQEQTDFFEVHYKKKCITIPCAVNLPLKKSSESNILLKYNLKPRSYFLFLGRLVQDKNPDYLIKAYLQSGIKDKQLVIAGDNVNDLAYVKYIHQLAAGNPSVIFTGAVYGLDKASLLKECLAFCIPSTLEGLPITLLEAMSYGCICLASDILACKEALGEFGIWVEPENVHDLIAKLLLIKKDEYYLREKQSFAVYQRVANNFTWKKIADQYDSYLKSLV